MTAATIIAAIPALLEIGSEGIEAIAALREAWKDMGKSPDEFDKLVKDEQADRAKQIDAQMDKLDRIRAGTE